MKLDVLFFKFRNLFQRQEMLSLSSQPLEAERRMPHRLIPCVYIHKFIVKHHLQISNQK